MRDALSMLDKIVSFTNGEVNYQHTLEHLNILDEDYYFKLIECMLDQDLAGAMLLFDDIMRKGFDEELVLSAFSEFIRNLLVAKDERIAGLLDVVENFKEKYVATAKRTDAGFLISALNILNETEINYKTARNKRLHVELALIRLTYLLQALELSATPEGMTKKKRVEEATPVAFRNIAMIKAPQRIVEKIEEPKLIIQEEKEKQKEKEEQTPATASAPAGINIKSSQLEKMRREIAERNNNTERQQPQSLEQEKLQQAWNSYTDALKENKNPAVQSFSLAILNIVSDTSFEVITNNNLEQKFIEQEKRMLSEHLQKIFANRTISFAVKITENPSEAVPVEKAPSKKDQFLMMAEEYPLIKELKDKLKLDLDY